jgi:hypothetical protein
MMPCIPHKDAVARSCDVFCSQISEQNWEPATHLRRLLNANLKSLFFFRIFNFPRHRLMSARSTVQLVASLMGPISYRISMMKRNVRRIISPVQSSVAFLRLIVHSTEVVGSLRARYQRGGGLPCEHAHPFNVRWTGQGKGAELPKVVDERWGM